MKAIIARPLRNWGRLSLFSYFNRTWNSRTNTSHSESNEDVNSRNTEPKAINWSEMVNRAHQSSMDIAFHYQTYLVEFIIPVTGAMSATMISWIVVPKILEKLYKYTPQCPLAFFSKSSTIHQVSYEKSLWGALEDPTKYFITFVAFSQIGMIVYRGTMIAPSDIEFHLQACRGAFVFSVVWFLYRLNANLFSTTLMTQTVIGLNRDKLSTLEKLSSLGLIILGVVGMAEALDVPMQSIVTVGGIGGVASAFAARDIIGNLLAGLFLQFLKPFGIGDNIKVGSVEGQVIEMGLATTTLINRKKFHVMIPNSFFSSQVIVNESRAQLFASLTKIPLRIEDIENIPLISKEINCMLKGYPKVFLGKDAPYCYISRIEQSFVELTLECNLKRMRRDELLAAEQDILLQAARIIRKHSAELGSNLNDQKNF